MTVWLLPGLLPELLPQVLKDGLQAPTEAMSPALARRRAAPPAATRQHLQSVVPPAAPAVTAIAPVVAPVASSVIKVPEPAIGSTILGSALREVAKIDRDLRREFPSFPISTPVSIRSKLEGQFALADRHLGEPTRTEQRRLSDGRRITKVTTPSGSYCITQKGAGASDGVDQLQDGSQQRQTSCGNLFN